MQKGLRIRDKVFYTPVDARIIKTRAHDNIVHPLCSLTFFCSLFGFRAHKFSIKSEIKLGKFSLTKPSIY